MGFLPKRPYHTAVVDTQRFGFNILVHNLAKANPALATGVLLALLSRPSPDLFTVTVFQEMQKKIERERGEIEAFLSKIHAERSREPYCGREGYGNQNLRNSAER